MYKYTKTAIQISFYCIIYNINYNIISNIYKVFKGIYNTLICNIINIFFTLLIYYMIYKFNNKNLFKYCKFNRKKRNISIYAVVLGISINIIAIIMLNIIDINTYNTDNLKTIQNIITENNLIASIITIGIIIPIFEEILFRGIVFNKLKQLFNIEIVIILQAFLFGLYHGEIVQIIFTIFLGLTLGLTYYYTESIYIPILIHASNNILSIISMKYLSTFEISIYVLFLSVMLSIVVFIFIINQIKKEKQNNQENKQMVTSL
ncbi:CPBP family intramembrane metalloprotease [Clostridiaceae bacterium M8S5]|nr:CPBP family intramembrane metalloprotease [Clostridiaceae bacterium M8S5]